MSSPEKRADAVRVGHHLRKRVSVSKVKCTSRDDLLITEVWWERKQIESSTNEYAALQAVEQFVESLDHSHFRPLQKQAFQCCTEACDVARSQDELQKRVQQCQQPVASAEQLVQQQLQQFQSRLQRCAQRCQDAAQEELPPKPDSKQVSRAESTMEHCIADCAEHYKQQIPKMQQETGAALQQLHQR